MSHLERHLNKLDEELVMRLLVDWKVCIGVLNKNYEEEILSYAKTQKLEEGKNVLLIHMNEVVGYGYDRWFEKFTSTTIRAIVIKDTYGNLTTHTAYPHYDENVIHTGKYFDFSIFGFEGEIYNIFNNYYQNHEFMVRYIPRKNPQVRVYIGNYSFVYNGKTLRVYDGEIERKSDLVDYYSNHIDAIPELYKHLTNPNSNAMLIKLLLALDHKKAVA